MDPDQDSSNVASINVAVDAPLWKTLMGTVIAVLLSVLLYQALQALIVHLPPIAVDASPVVRNVSVLVRYLIVGSVSLVTFMFSVVGLGLLAYSGQLMWQKLTAPR